MSIRAKSIEAAYRKAQTLLHDQRWVDAARAFAELMPQLREQEDVLGQSRVLTHLAQIFTVLGQRDQAVEFYREARRLAIEACDQQLHAICAHQLGCLLFESEPDQAKAMLVESRSACIVLGDKRGESLSLALIGEIEIQQGQCEAGMSKMLQALKQMPPMEEKTQLLEQVKSLAGRLSPERFAQMVEEFAPCERRSFSQSP